MKGSAIALFLFLSIGSLAQTADYYPDFPSTYFYHLALANPGHVPIDTKLDLSLTYKFSTGPIKDLSTLAFSGAKVWGHDKRSTHVGRFSGINEQEGPYIQYPRAYLQYAYRLQLEEHTSLSAGVALGMVGIFFSAPSATTSIFLPDGSLGLTFRHRRITLGGSSMQLLQSKAAPLLASIRFSRYYQLHAEAEKELGIDWSCKASLLWRLLPRVKDDMIGTVAFEYAETLRLGTAYRHQVGLAFFGAAYVHTGDSRLLFSFTYNSPFFANVPRLQQSMEIGMAYEVR